MLRRDYARRLAHSNQPISAAQNAANAGHPKLAAKLLTMYAILSGDSPDRIADALFRMGFPDNGFDVLEAAGYYKYAASHAHDLPDKEKFYRELDGLTTKQS